MKLRQEISQKLEQKQKLSIKVQNSIKLLQCNTLDLNNTLEEIIQENPLLEVERNDYDLIDDSDQEMEEDYSENSYYGLSLPQRNPDFDGYDFDRIESHHITFDEVVDQVASYILDENEYEIFQDLLEQIDERGILTKTKAEIFKNKHIDEKILNSAINKVRNAGFEGIFSETIEELKDLREDDYFPSSGFDDNVPLRYIEPDIFIEFVKEKFIVNVKRYGLVMNVDESYEKIIAGESSEAKKYLEAKLDEANYYLSAMERRENTLLFIGREIVQRNPGFLLGRTKKINLMTMTEVSDFMEVNLSTISRAVNGKYILTPVGTFPLRYFFGNKMNKEEILSTIAEIIKNNPKISDSKISKQLNQKGMKVARRTVNKYRKSIGMEKNK
ncbi:MAG: polymerase sigma-54 factor [Kosmotogales bacterium]|nr:polymerase sigma-54 factor [Kosmotogales bacterium]